MKMESHKKKKPTKKQKIQQFQTDLTNKFNKELKKNLIKNIMIGWETAMTMIYEYCDNHTVEEVKEFCNKNLKNKDVLEKLANGKEKNESNGDY